MKEQKETEEIEELANTIAVLRADIKCVNREIEQLQFHIHKLASCVLTLGTKPREFYDYSLKEIIKDLETQYPHLRLPF